VEKIIVNSNECQQRQRVHNGTIPADRYTKAEGLTRSIEAMSDKKWLNVEVLHHLDHRSR